MVLFSSFFSKNKKMALFLANLANSANPVIVTTLSISKRGVSLAPALIPRSFLYLLFFHYNIWTFLWLHQQQRAGEDIYLYFLSFMRKPSEKNLSVRRSLIISIADNVRFFNNKNHVTHLSAGQRRTYFWTFHNSIRWFFLTTIRCY